MDTEVFQTNPKLRGLLLILIFTFAASGIALAVLAQVNSYHREQIYLATEAALPVHKTGGLENRIIGESDSPLATLEFVTNNGNWKTYRNKYYGFEIRFPSHYHSSSLEAISIGVRPLLESDFAWFEFWHLKGPKQTYLYEREGKAVNINGLETLEIPIGGNIFTDFLYEVLIKIPTTQDYINLQFGVKPPNIINQIMQDEFKEIIKTFKFIQ